MNRKSIISAALISIGLTSVSAFAAEVDNLSGQQCELGQVCSIPGNDGGKTFFSVTPQTGVNYQCDITSTRGTLRVWVSDGAEYHISHGDGYFKVNGNYSLKVEGHFKHPEDPTKPGTIKFRKIKGHGAVSCRPA